MELSDIESFDFFFESIWKKQTSNGDTESNSKVLGNIVDTIVFQQGKPYKWLFTSVKTGVMSNLLCHICHRSLVFPPHSISLISSYLFFTFDMALNVIAGDSKEAGD